AAPLPRACDLYWMTHLHQAPEELTSGLSQKILLTPSSLLHRKDSILALTVACLTTLHYWLSEETIITH
ncbi:hypothetical protein AMECASPLE_010518, partial [Ameca splendens]